MAGWRSTIQNDPSLTPASDDSALETAGDFTRGAAQSASFGFADELAGAAEASAEVLSPDKQLADFLDLYKKHRDESRDLYKQAQERSPTAYFSGELAGGLVPGFGAAKAGIAGGKTLGQIVRKGIGTGALAGGAYGAGMSEADLTQIPQEGMAPVGQLAGDVATSTAVGGALGGLIPTVTSGIPAAVKSMAGKSGFVKDVGEAAKRGFAGEDLVGQEARRATERSVDELAEQLDVQLKGEINRGRGLKEEARALAEEQGLTGDIGTILQKYRAEVEAMPARLTREKAEKKEFLNLIDEILEGPEVQKTRIIPGTTEVIPGQTIQSGEEAAMEAIREKLAKLNVRKQLGEPEKAAEAKLRQQFGKSELTSEAVEDPLVPFTKPTKEMTTAGTEGLTTTAPTGGPMAQMIQDIKPGEIKQVTDPQTGKRFMAFLDEATGKPTLQPIEEIAGQTPVKFRTTPEKVETFSVREGGTSKAGAEELESIIDTLKQTSNLGEESFKTKGISRAATELTKDLKGLQRGEQFGEAGQMAQKADEIMAAGLKARELLFPSIKGLTEQEQAVMQKRLSETIRKLEQDTGAAASARFVVEKALEDLQQINPKMTEIMKQRILDRASAYDIAKKIGAESAIQGRLLSTVQGAALGGANIAGSAARDMHSFIKGATPELLQDVIGKLTAKGSVPRDLIEKLNAAVSSDSKRRNAILFTVMQNPDYRDMLGITGSEQ